MSASTPAPALVATPASARASVLALMLAFLTDHGPCVWQRAGMPPPDRLAVVPTGAGARARTPLLRLGLALPAPARLLAGPAPRPRPARVKQGCNSSAIHPVSRTRLNKRDDGREQNPRQQRGREHQDDA